MGLNVPEAIHILCLTYVSSLMYSIYRFLPSWETGAIHCLFLTVTIALGKISLLLITAAPGLDTGEGSLETTEDTDAFFGSVVSSALVDCCTSPVSATLNLEQLAHQQCCRL